ncbi:uncharacterized protein [Lolium perenne]|uniref:uncharacterized protein isoform X3 n=1 Tax=Lolium perenne TaxID=4522 RepID=UPI0021F64344|nr:uncharacterized protein LOC127294874 isoform X3 [Lolium perenne]
MCHTIYIFVCLVISGMVPYTLLGEDAPLAEAFAAKRLRFVTVLSIGAVADLTTTLLVGLYVQFPKSSSARSTTIWLTGPLCFFHPCRQRTPPISTERFGSEAILSSAARRCRSGRKQSNQARVMVSSGLPHRCCFIRPILPRKTRRPSSSFAETFAASMETVKIPTDELLEAMLKKLGLPCPRYDNKHAGGGCFEVTLTYYPPWHYLQSLIPPHSK